MTANIIPEDDKNRELIHIERKQELKDIANESMIPFESFKRNGCSYCEWRAVEDRCPHYKQDLFLIKICSKRIDWLLDLTPHYDKKPTISQWNRDFTLALNATAIPRYKQAEDDARARMLLVLEDDENHDSIITRLTREAEMFHHHWTTLSKTIIHYEDQQVNRDTTKKHEHSIKQQITPSDVSKMLNDANKIINAKLVKDVT